MRQSIGAKRYVKSRHDLIALPAQSLETIIELEREEPISL